MLISNECKRIPIVSVKLKKRELSSLEFCVDNKEKKQSLLQAKSSDTNSQPVVDYMAVQGEESSAALPTIYINIPPT